MAEIKTQPTDVPVDEFLAGVTDERRRADTSAVVSLLRRITGEEPVMWGPSIIGFGHIRHRSPSGREVDWFVAGLSPRKQALTIYLSDGVNAHSDLLARLGPNTTGVGCIYIKRLDDVDSGVLAELLTASVAEVRAAHP